MTELGFKRLSVDNFQQPDPTLSLFIDARPLGAMEDRTHRILTDADIARIAGTYHAWRGDAGDYADIPGFCRAASLDDVRGHNHVLTPGRYVGAAAQEADSEPFAAKIARLTTTLEEQFAESSKLEAMIWKSLVALQPHTIRSSDE